MLETITNFLRTASDFLYQFNRSYEKFNRFQNRRRRKNRKKSLANDSNKE